ncbi:MAG TPA: DUF4129 domain-containing protein [Polyangia bacterium]|jgi:hypothetical protein
MKSRTCGALLVAGVLAGGAAHAAPPPVEHALGETLKAPRYKFCHDPKYALTADEIRWCALLPPASEARAGRCPAFPQACQAGATAKRIEQRKPIDFKLPDFGGLGRLVFYTLIFGAVGVLVYLLARSLVGRRGLRLPTDELPSAPLGPASPEAGIAAAVERDVARLLARARAAAAAGDYLAAVGDLHAALLRRLEGDGHIRIHPSATNGDYLRELRGRSPALEAPVRDVASAVESVQFGVTAPADGIYQSVAARVTALLELSSRGIVASVLLALLTMASLSCNSSLRDDWQASPSGSAAVSAFLTAAGIEARERTRSLHELGNPENGPGPAGKGDNKGDKDKKVLPARQIVILPDAEMDERDWESLRAAATKQDLTIVVAGPRKLPSWIAVELVETGAGGPVHVTAELQRWRRSLQDDDHDDEAPGSSAALAVTRAELALRANVPGDSWVNVGKPTAHHVLLQRGKKPYAVALDLAAGRVIVLADSALYTNASLPVADDAAVLRALLGIIGGPVDVVTQETGLTATTPFESVSRGRLAPFMAQLCALLILLYLLKGAAFGRLMDRQTVRRRRFSEHVEALGLQYARARAARHASGAYAAWTVERLRERIHLPGDRGLGDLASAIAARTGRPLGEVARLLFQAHHDDAAASEAEPRTRAAAAEHLTTIRELCELLADASGGRATTGHTRQRETIS